MELQAVVKAFYVLETLCETSEAQMLGQVAAANGLPKPTAYRILNTLTGLGYVEKLSGGRYRANERLARLSKGSQDQQLIEVAGPVLQQLRQRTSETVNLGVLRKRRIVYLLVLESLHPLRRVTVPQSSDPFHCTALGRILAAHLASDQQNHLLQNRPLARRTQKTVTNPNELLKILQRAKQDGVAVEWDQAELGVMCVAAPIIESNTVVAAISVSVPTARVTHTAEKKLIQQVCAAAKQLSRSLESAKGAR